VAEFPPETIDEGDFVLRRTGPEDASRIADTIAGNLGHLSSWMVWAVPVAGTVDEQQRRIHRTIAAWESGTSFQYLAVHVDSGAHLGNFALERRVGAGALEIGYWLAQDATGYGYATAAARALTEVALDLAGVERVEIHCDAANLRSVLVPQRLGYRLDRIEVQDVRAPAGSGRSMIWVYPPS
jgi:RimJ/RimL family protein N-acetyltransferase